MNIGGGEAADQLVRMMLSFGDISIRLGGSALKNVLALTMALAKENKTISGKVNLGKMLRETRDLRQFPMTPEQYQEFKKLAKKQKILFSAIRDKDDQGKLVDVILPVTELDRANMIFERILYSSPEQEVPQSEKAAPQRKEEKEKAQEKRQDRGKADPQAARVQPQKAPEGQERKDQSWREAIPPKKDFRSGQGSPDTRPSSSTPKKAAVTRMTSDRPSVEGRLKAYRAELDQKRTFVPAKEKSKGKSKPKSR